MKSSSEVKIYTVSEITKRINGVLENNFSSIWIEGEVSNYKKHPISGHVYLTLKDEHAQLRCMIYKDIGKSIKFELKDGLKILCFGRIGVYQIWGQYQLYIEKIEPQGYGALQLAFEQLKEKLQEEGLFEDEHKKPIPLLPARIGVVTSSAGAAIRDILNVINRRFPNVHVILNPVRVQGKKAAGEIAQAIKEFNQYKNIDVLIVGRGGGSLEDLWSFNEEVVARAIFSSRIPIISAVGHQKDFMISDLVADVRAATPTKAAEIVIGKKEELEEKLLNYSRRLRSGLKYYSQELDKRLSALTRSRFFRQPESLIIQQQQHLDDITIHLRKNFLNYVKAKKESLIDVKVLKKSAQQYIKLKEQKFKNYIGKLESLSPLAILTRGYSVTFQLPSKKILKNIKSVKKRDTVQTILSDGKFISVVKEVKNA